MNILEFYDFNFLEILNYYGLKYKKIGENYFIKCPFHIEKTPSCSISPNKGLFHCFGCGESGNIIHFISKIENINFLKSLKKLEEIFNIKINFKKNEYSEWLDFFEHYLLKFHNNLLQEIKKNNNNLLYNFLKKRNLLKENILKIFKIGFVLPNEKFGFDPEKEKQILFTIKKENNNNIFYPFNNRIVFPLFNKSGFCMGFTGRSLDLQKKDRKYFNTKNYKFFKKNNNFYGLNIANIFIKEEQKIFITEGVMDVISCYNVNLKNTVSILGTTFSINHYKQIKDFNIKEVILFLDADDTGIKKTLKNFIDINNFFDEDYSKIKIKIFLYPEKYLIQGYDPDNLINALKQEKIDIKKFINNNSKDILEFLFHIYKIKTKNVNINESIKKKWIEKIKKYFVELKNEKIAYEIISAFANQINYDKKIYLFENKREKENYKKIKEKKQINKILLDEEIKIFKFLFFHPDILKKIKNKYNKEFENIISNEILINILNKVENQEIDINNILQLEEVINFLESENIFVKNFNKEYCQKKEFINLIKFLLQEKIKNIILKKYKKESLPIKKYIEEINKINNDFVFSF